MSEKQTMTLNLTALEMEVLTRHADEHQMTKTAVMRTALRLYDLVQARLKAGETMSFSGDQHRVMEFVGPDFYPSNPDRSEK